jgi:hypothetical protein
MEVRRIAALSAAAALALGVGACGSSSSNDEGGSSTASEASTTATSGKTATETTARKTDTTAAKTGGNGLTPPGAKLGFGDEATVAWVPPARYSASGGQQGYRMQVSVDGIERGTLDDFKNIDLDADQKRSTPYYVTISVKALEDVKAGTDDPDIAFKAIDDRGQEQGEVIFFGTFDRCENADVPRPFTSGTSYDSCLTYLVPGGGSIEEVRWNDGPSRKNEVTPYFDNPIVWNGS